jgi:hypothetical protein
MFRRPGSRHRRTSLGPTPLLRLRRGRFPATSSGRWIVSPTPKGGAEDDDDFAAGLGGSKNRAVGTFSDSSIPRIGEQVEICVEPAAAEALDDKQLDASVSSGEVNFSIGAQG